MDDLNTYITLKNQFQTTSDIVGKGDKNEALFFKLLHLKTDFHLAENSSYFDQKTVKTLLVSDIFTEKLKIILNQSNALNNLIKLFDNQCIKLIFIKFLDVSKNDIIHSIKIPKLLSEPKYKNIFWQLLFTYKKHEIFEVEFQKLIKNISKEYSKKKVVEVLNFGIALSKKQH